MMDRALFGVLGALGVSLLLVGLTFSHSTDPPADFRFVNGTEPKTLDPQLMTGQPEGRIAEAIFEGLTRTDARTHRPAPGVAESWEVSPDGKRYTFHLRENARWTDGRPVSAADFVHAFRRLLDPKLGSEYAYILFPVRFAEALNAFDAHADALVGPIAEGLAELSREHGQGLDAASWQRFLSRLRVHDALRHSKDAQVSELLSRRTGTVSAAELDELRVSMQRTSTALRKDAQEARDHFGRDGGAFASGDRTLVVELRAPTPYFLEITSFYPTYPVPSWLTDDPVRRDDWFLPEHMVSNGPYRLSRWLVNDHIRLERSDSYWGRAQVHTKSIDALSIENGTTALNLYLTSAVDWLPGSYPSDLVDALKTRPDFYENPGMVVYFYRFNTTRPPFDDVRVREALNLAVDRSEIVDRVLGLGQLPATTFVPPGMAGYHAPESGIRHDVAHAKELLAEAGYPDGHGFPEIGILYNTSESHRKVAEVVADELRRALGIRVNTYNQEWQSFLDTVRSLDYGMARAGWVGDYADPNTFLDLWVTNGGNNQTGWSSPLYDRLIRAASDVSDVIASPDPLLRDLKWPGNVRAAIDRARSATSDGARLAAYAEIRMLLFREAEAILVRDEFPILPLYFYVVSGLVRPSVRGFYSTLVFEDGTTAPNLQDTHPLRDVWVEGAGSR